LQVLFYFFKFNSCAAKKFGEVECDLFIIMKKAKNLFWSLTVFLVTLLSCSRDKDDELKFLKKIVETSADGIALTTIFTYDGNKIVNIDGVLQHKAFTYTGDLISKIVTLDKNSKLSSTVDYTYVKDKLVRATSINKYVVNYIYNSNEAVSYEKFVINLGNQEVKVLHGTVSFINNNVKNDFRIADDVGAGVVSEYSLSFEYDAKKNPFQSILGYNKLLDNKEGMSVNNRLMTLVTSSVTENNQIISSANFYKSTFKYDLDNYPTEQVSEASISNNGYLKVEYFY
jgi:hypothetical protein